MGILKNVKLSPFKNKTDELGYSCLFGPRTITVGGKKYQNNHTGIDFAYKGEIVALARGKVTGVRTNIKGYSETYSSGNYVTLQHGNCHTTYCHLDYGSVKVKVGDMIEKGTVLGTDKIKTTGHSTGLHLHLGIKVNGSWVDPVPYLQGTKSITDYNSGKSYSGYYPTLPNRKYFWYDFKNKKILDRGIEVKKLQMLLNWACNLKIKVDGVLGQDTYNAILTYQKMYSLENDGCFGRACLNKAKTITK